MYSGDCRVRLTICRQVLLREYSQAIASPRCRDRDKDPAVVFAFRRRCALLRLLPPPPPLLLLLQTPAPLALLTAAAPIGHPKSVTDTVDAGASQSGRPAESCCKRGGPLRLHDRGGRLGPGTNDGGARRGRATPVVWCSIQLQPAPQPQTSAAMPRGTNSS